MPGSPPVPAKSAHRSIMMKATRVCVSGRVPCPCHVSGCPLPVKESLFPHTDGAAAVGAAAAGAALLPPMRAPLPPQDHSTAAPSTAIAFVVGTCGTNTSTADGAAAVASAAGPNVGPKNPPPAIACY